MNTKKFLSLKPETLKTIELILKKIPWLESIIKKNKYVIKEKEKIIQEIQSHFQSRHDKKIYNELLI